MTPNYYEISKIFNIIKMTYPMPNTPIETDIIRINKCLIKNMFKKVNMLINKINNTIEVVTLKNDNMLLSYIKFMDSRQ